MTLTEKSILMCLPDEPEGFHYEVTQESHMWWAVWLVHESNYDYACGKKVQTIWGFVKKDGLIYSPINHKKPSSKKVCPLSEAYKVSCYTTIVPKCTSIIDLL